MKYRHRTYKHMASRILVRVHSNRLRQSNIVLWKLSYETETFIHYRKKKNKKKKRKEEGQFNNNANNIRGERAFTYIYLDWIYLWLCLFNNIAHRMAEWNTQNIRCIFVPRSELEERNTQSWKKFFAHVHTYMYI